MSIGGYSVLQLVLLLLLLPALLLTYQKGAAAAARLNFLLGFLQALTALAEGLKHNTNLEAWDLEHKVSGEGGGINMGLLNVANLTNVMVALQSRNVWAPEAFRSLEVVHTQNYVCSTWPDCAHLCVPGWVAPV